MKKSGFTLIETVASLFVIIILFNIGVSLSKMGKNLLSDVKSTGYIYDIQNLITYGKAVCREKNKNGKITVSANDNQIRFVEGWDNIDKTITLPKDIKIIKTITLPIRYTGKISQGNTIKLMDKYGKKQYITIGVGADSIDVKDKNGEDE